MKINNKLILYLILLVIFTQSVLAIGVSPAVVKLNFEPGLEKIIPIRILNNENTDFNALISIRGDLKEYIELEQNIIEFSSSEDSKTFMYTVKLPEFLDRPGTHLTEIIIAEQPRVTTGDGTKIAARSAVISQLQVQVPYPGEYMEAKLHVSKGQVDQNTQFAISIFNVGKEELYDVYAKIEIYEGNEKIDELTTNELNLQSAGKDRLLAYWLAEQPGKYKVKAKVVYSGKTILLEQSFEVGGIDLRIESLSMHDFKLGQIVRVYTLITNNWNENIYDLYTRMVVRDATGKAISEMESNTINIDPYSSASTIAYWDTNNLYPGLYDLEVILNYEGLEISKTFEAEVNHDEITINGMPTGQAVGTSILFSPTGLTLIVVILANLIILNVILFVFLKKKPPQIISKFLLFLR